MNILIIGSGGREHVLADAYAKNKKVKKIFITPGNPFIDFKNKKSISLTEVSSVDFENIKKIIYKYKIDLVDVSSDDPLSLGFVDKLGELGIKVFGPTKLASEIEWNKEWSRNFMLKYHLPIPHFKSFNDPRKGIFYVKSLREQSLFIKASGLALGKGAIRAGNKKEAIDAIKQMKNFGDSGKTFLVEEEMIGEEFSLFVICDGENYQIIGSAQDHKRVFNGDEGLNTGGMGCVSNPQIINSKTLKEIDKKILIPFMNGMKKEKRDYSGILYLGGMITNDGVKIVEFNSRWGDPEAEVLIPGIKTDYLNLIESVINKKLKKIKLKTDNLKRVSVAGCAKGYPSNYSSVKGKIVRGLEKINKFSNVLVFGAGISKEKDRFIVNGGRVFHIVGEGINLDAARSKAYGAISYINVSENNLHYRTDIGWRDLERVI